MKKLSLFIIIISTFSLYGKNEPSDRDKLYAYNKLMYQLNLRLEQRSEKKENILEDLKDLQEKYKILHNSLDTITKRTAIARYNIVTKNIRMLTQEARNSHKIRTSDPRYFRPE